MADGGGVRVRGVSYEPAGLPDGTIAHDLRAIREQLHCTAVLLPGTDPDRQRVAALTALDLGLDVWLQARADDRPPAALLEHLAGLAATAETLRERATGRVTLVVGNELSLMCTGIVPGPQLLRLQLILRARRLLARRIARRVDAVLAEAVAVARARFRGPITYCAAAWEPVDWSRFDAIGVNLYRTGDDHAAYARRVRALVADHPRTPVAITEFGCGAFRGADRVGPGAFLIVRWWSTPPRIKPGHVRDEAVQAAYVDELIQLYEAAGVDACFAFTFAMRDFPHHDDPARDLDMAGFGLVAVSPEDPARWRPKAAFDAVARRYERAAQM